MELNNTTQIFNEGLVIGIDVGTSGLGYAVRRGATLLEAGVAILDSNIANLEKRRERRGMRRTIRSRRQRLSILRNLLVETGFPKPVSESDEQKLSPSLLRLKALRGEKLSSEEIHRAVFHLWKRRGYMEPEWAKNRETNKKEKDAKDESNKSVKATKEKMLKAGAKYPCEYMCLLEGSIDKAGKIVESGKEKEDVLEGHKGIVFDRNDLKAEFEEIVKQQSRFHPALAGIKDKILYGDEVELKYRHKKHRGVYYQRLARFDNRKPGKCLRCGENNVCRKNTVEYASFQTELALMNFRVVNGDTGVIERPCEEAIEEIKAQFRAKHVGQKKLLEFAQKNKLQIISTIGKTVKTEDADGVKFADESGKECELNNRQQALYKALFMKKAKLEAKFWDGWYDKYNYRSIDTFDHEAISPNLSGRARYCRKCLKALKEEYESRSSNVQPLSRILAYKNMGKDKQLIRYINSVANPLVRNRLEHLGRILSRLEKKHGIPDMVVIEAVREALSKDQETKVQKIQLENRKLRTKAKEYLEDHNVEPTGTLTKKYLLAVEVNWECPYCRKGVGQNLDELEIEHIIPVARGGTNERKNLTVSCRECNSIKKNKTPFEAFGHSPDWAGLAKNAAEKFKGLKAKIFLFRGTAEEAADEFLSPVKDLTQTAYLARTLRELVLLRFGWLTEDGNKLRDPVYVSKGPGVRCQFTNGFLTSNLRRNWNFEGLLDSEDGTQKNRADARHHALDAIVICSTLPWKAFKLADKEGWRNVDEKGHIRFIKHPFGWQRDEIEHKLEAVVPQWKKGVSKHTQMYNTTIYGTREVNGETNVTVRKPLVGFVVGKKNINIKDIYPQVLQDCINTAWEQYITEFSQDFVNTLQHPDKTPMREVDVSDSAGQTVRTSLISFPAKDIQNISSDKIRSYIDKAWNKYISAFPQDFVKTLKNPGNKMPVKNVHIAKSDNIDVFPEIRPGARIEYTIAKGWIVYRKGKKWAVHTVKPWEKMKDVMSQYSGKDARIFIRNEQVTVLPDKSYRDGEYKAGVYRITTCMNEQKFALSENCIITKNLPDPKNDAKKYELYPSVTKFMELIGVD